ncbi:germination protein YpeB [Oceanobacillus sp. FSL H7-0719]|uniref:germination protein YpeB n=1 Tax=Oceanobacillus sp. FSL H7-0719 TaxID=2954507 RepID=UPI0032499A28
MFRWITIGVLSIAVIGTGVWGYLEHQEKNAILIQAENSYQKSFHELSYYMDLLHDEIGTVLAMNSHDRLSPKFVDIWRITSEAHTNVSQLPLGLLPFNKTEEFLSDIGDFTYRTAIRNLDDEPLSGEETDILKELYTQAGDIKDELRRTQHLAMENNLRWMDVQLALVNNEQSDNTIIDGLKTVEKNVEGYSEANQQTGLIGVNAKVNYFEKVSGKELNEKEALSFGKKLLHVKTEDDLEITSSGKGADIPLYSINYSNGDKKAYLDLTKKGGHPLTLLIDRPVKEKKVSLNEGAKKAEAYIEDLEFKDMQLYQSAEYDTNGMYSFLYNQNGIRVYSDSIEVKVALDNGEIIGLTTSNYFSNHHIRKVTDPEITEEEAKEKVNPQVEIHESHLAIIDNDLGEEVLAYEFLGTLGEDTFRIFINALDGKEEKIEKLGGKELKYAINN